MQSNTVKAQLQSGKPQFGTWLSLGNVFAARFLARTGLSWLTVDLEHNPIDMQTAGHLFGAIADAGCVPLARVPSGSHHEIKRVLDAGAMGIVVPMVNTVEQAKEIIAAAKYPPIGNRSVGGSLHALNYSASAGDYYSQANEEVLVILQTESPEGVDNAPEIYALPGCDGVFVGPNDLRAQMRDAEGNNPTDEEFQSMLNRILECGKAAGTPVGYHAQTPEHGLELAKQGWQFIAIGSDLKFMMDSASAAVEGLQIAAGSDLARY